MKSMLCSRATNLKLTKTRKICWWSSSANRRCSKNLGRTKNPQKKLNLPAKRSDPYAPSVVSWCRRRPSKVTRTGTPECNLSRAIFLAVGQNCTPSMPCSSTAVGTTP
uniref:(northern house mosquito) hypothetical protein n=1 Tax=Culex pipiens TaxID=7175 RepID=A0A8D8C5D3_CULPI